MMIEGFEKGEPSGVIAKKVYRAIRTVQDWRKKFYKKGIQKPPSEK
jgi:transposase